MSFKSYESELMEKINIVEFLIQHGIDLKPSGRNYIACCPVHKEKTPSFVADVINNGFFCFGCGINGDAMSYLRDIKKLTISEARDHLKTYIQNNQHGLIEPIEELIPVLQMIKTVEDFMDQTTNLIIELKKFLLDKKISLHEKGDK